MSKRLIKLLPVAVALAFSGVASASISKEIPSVVVKYGDLSVNTKAGVATLHARLKTAERCVSDAVKQSVAAVGNPELTRFHRYGGRLDFVASN